MRWTVEIVRHDVAEGRNFENASAELKIYLTDEQVTLVRSAILHTLAQGTIQIALGAQ